MAENTIDVQVRVDTASLQKGVQEVRSFSAQVQQDLQSVSEMAGSTVPQSIQNMLVAIGGINKTVGVIAGFLDVALKADRAINNWYQNTVLLKSAQEQLNDADRAAVDIIRQLQEEYDRAADNVARNTLSPVEYAQKKLQDLKNQPFTFSKYFKDLEQEPDLPESVKKLFDPNKFGQVLPSDLNARLVEVKNTLDGIAAAQAKLKIEAEQTAAKYPAGVDPTMPGVLGSRGPDASQLRQDSEYRLQLQYAERMREILNAAVKASEAREQSAQQDIDAATKLENSMRRSSVGPLQPEVLSVWHKTKTSEMVPEVPKIPAEAQSSILNGILNIPSVKVLGPQQSPGIADPKTTQQVKQLGAQIEQVKGKTSEWQKVTQTLGTSFNNSLRGMLQGTMTLQQGIESIFRSVYAAVVDTLLKMVEQWVMQHVVMAAISKITGATQIGSAAAEAGANAYAATAIIPFVGPELAPAAASTAYAGAMSFGALNMASAAGGWGIVPQDQLALVHKNEMVLPPALAERVRDMTSGSRGGEIHVHAGGNSFSAADAAGMDRLMRQHEKAIVRTIQRLHRNGALKLA